MKKIIAITLVLVVANKLCFAEITPYHKTQLDKGFNYIKSNKYDAAALHFGDIIRELEPQIRRRGYRMPEDPLIQAKAVASYGLGIAMVRNSTKMKGDAKREYNEIGIEALKNSCANGFDKACNELNKKQHEAEEVFGETMRMIAKNPGLLRKIKTENLSSYTNLSGTTWYEGDAKRIKWTFDKNGNLKIKYTKINEHTSNGTYIGKWEQYGNKVRITYTYIDEKYGEERCWYDGLIQNSKIQMSGAHGGRTLTRNAGK